MPPPLAGPRGPSLRSGGFDPDMTRSEPRKRTLPVGSQGPVLIPSKKRIPIKKVWNWQFEQAVWADAQAKAEWDTNDKWMQYYGMRAAQMAQIWRDVFGRNAEERLTLVISSQTGWLGLEAEVLEAPLWQALGHPRPASLFVPML